MRSTTCLPQYNQGATTARHLDFLNRFMIFLALLHQRQRN